MSLASGVREGWKLDLGARMEQFRIVSSEDAPHHLKQLRRWFTAEWGEIDSFAGPNSGFTVPSPLLVVDGEKLLGGLAFTSYPAPEGDSLGLWINALMVVPEQRGVGLGSRLIQRAEAEAADVNQTELFVYADLTTIYSRLGWEILSRSGERTVMKKVVSA